MGSFLETTIASLHARVLQLDGPHARRVGRRADQPPAEGEAGPAHYHERRELSKVAQLAIDQLEATFAATYPKAVDKVLKNRDVLLTQLVDGFIIEREDRPYAA